MNDLGPKLKVGGVNITARYKCGFRGSLVASAASGAWFLRRCREFIIR